MIATDINETKLRELDGTPGITTRVLNVLDSDAIHRAVAEIGRIDVLFNCAGVVHSGTLLEMPDKELEFAFDLNVWAQVHTIKAILPQMIERGDGAIINMATVASSIKAVPNRAAYSISKAAVIGLTKSVAADYVSKKGIEGQRHLPGYGSKARRCTGTLGGDRRCRGSAPRLHRAPADRPHRAAVGSGGPRGLSRRRDLYDGADPHHRWRLGGSGRAA